ncbi:MAG: hypothetical protein JO348_00630 [Alphaproteobacteria bacterium]|nr:hypothetical protein [Alphaproteobacteria bacterium]MBV9418251.1 hypothetical protein [Alphaproteobacteria bacterium]
MSRGVLIFFVIILGAAGFFGYTRYDQIRNYLDERSGNYKIEENPDYVVLQGAITERGGDRLAALLAKPAITRLVINGSPGGLIGPALKAAKVIHDRQLKVTALGECDQACTVLLAAGAGRIVLADTQMGFHEGPVAGIEDTTTGWDQAETYYTGAGMSADTLGKVKAAGAAPYQPTLRELIEGGFITEVFVQTSGNAIEAKRWCELHKDQCDRTGHDNHAAMQAAGG